LNDTDFEKFLEYILTAKGKYDFYLLAYVLMSNHYHLLIKTTKPNLSKIMHYINGSYTTYFNVKRGRTGHLFQGRYKSLVIDADSYFQELTRYIHLNPIRAKMVENPGDYKWSSYKAYIGRKRKDTYIDKQEIHKYLDMTGGSYKLFVDRMSGEEDNIFKDVYGGFLLGRVGFIKEKLKELKTQVESDEISYRKELNVGIEPDIIIEEVARRYKKNPEKLINSKTRPAIEKQIAIYLIRRYTGLTNGEIGKIFKMKAQAVSKAGIKIERLMEENRKIRNQVKKLISIFQG
jgi:REP element-mobilizing transposase RayT